MTTIINVILNLIQNRLKERFWLSSEWQLRSARNNWIIFAPVIRSFVSIRFQFVSTRVSFVQFVFIRLIRVYSRLNQL